MAVSSDKVFIHAFVAGIQLTFRALCHMEVIEAEAVLHSSLRKGAGPSAVAGMIQVRSRENSCAVALCFPVETYLKIMERMLEEPQPQLSVELQDGAGELMNIVFGHAKSSLNQQSHQIEMALPKVVLGNLYALPELDGQNAVLIPFNSDIGDFHFTLTTSTAQEKSHV